MYVDISLQNNRCIYTYIITYILGALVLYWLAYMYVYIYDIGVKNYSGVKCHFRKIVLLSFQFYNCFWVLNILVDRIK